MLDQQYTGRFAPTPSGPLHFGSIVAALGSYLQAKHHQGNWLVRIEDVDTTRARDGVDILILEQLEKLGLFWDNEVLYQSRRTDVYQQALDRLIDENLIFACRCSRKEVGHQPYPGTCRNAQININEHHALRIKTEDISIQVPDLCQPEFTHRLKHETGDFIVKRSDGLFAYHLAVVVDDAEQKITEIVRGADLLDSTPSQIYLQQCLSLSTPDYLHLPVAVDATGSKLSKTDQAITISHQAAELILCQTLEFLGQALPEQHTEASKEELLDWAIAHWDVNRIPRQKTISVA